MGIGSKSRAENETKNSHKSLSEKKKRNLIWERQEETFELSIFVKCRSQGDEERHEGKKEKDRKNSFPVNDMNHLSLISKD